MKKLTALLLAGVIAFSFTGCTAQIEDPEVALGGLDATGTGEVQTISVEALEAKTKAPVTLPEKVAPVYGVSVSKNAKGAVDYSNLKEGYVLVKYTGGKNVRVKIQIYLTDTNKYTYNLNNAGEYEIFPLSEGDGKYTIKVFEQVEGTKYSSVFSCTVDMTLRNDFLPFLYSNQYVNYADAPNVVAKAVELTTASTDNLAKTTAIYKFVTGELTYDKAEAQAVTDGTLVGYIPDLEEVLSTKKGICFDYASLMAGMMRSQNIPCKLVFGYAGTVYHAWIKVFIDGVGWVDMIQFDGENWSMMDPTFVSTSKNPDAISQFVGSGSSYTEKTFY